MRRTFLILIVLLLLVSCSPAAPGLGYTVITHPDGALYVGDQVSFEILTPKGEPDEETVDVSLNGEGIGSTTFMPFGIGQRNQATLWWVWDTSGLEPDRYTLTFTLGSGPSWTETVLLRPAERVPPPEPDAQWAFTTTECCSIHYITGTAAERDINYLTDMTQEQSELVSAQMGTSLDERVDITFMPRVIGHGGFAWDGLYISYLDGNYAGNEVEIVLHHEFVHYHDGQVGGEYQPSIFQEGLATYLSGGHFKIEPIRLRAAALLELGWYIPLETLANDFYTQQHETGYLEAAALVEYLYERYGPGAFNEFYRTIPFPNGQTNAQAIDTALRDNFGISLMDLEAAFKNHLGSQSVPEAVRADLEVTVHYFDTLRRYQSRLDSSAYFLTAWLPDGHAMRESGIVADFTRRPRGLRNIVAEWLLLRAHAEWFGEDYRSAETTLEWVNWFLGALEG